jgi:hypothetical protein
VIDESFVLSFKGDVSGKLKQGWAGGGVRSWFVGNEGLMRKFWEDFQQV